MLKCAGLSGTFSFVSFWMSGSEETWKRRANVEFNRPSWLPPHAQLVDLAGIKGWYINLDMMDTMNPAQAGAQEDREQDLPRRSIRKEQAHPGFVQAYPHGWIPKEWLSQYPDKLGPRACKYCELVKEFAPTHKYEWNKFAPSADRKLCAICAFWNNEDKEAAKHYHHPYHQHYHH